MDTPSDNQTDIQSGPDILADTAGIIAGHEMPTNAIGGAVLPRTPLAGRLLISPPIRPAANTLGRNARAAIPAPIRLSRSARYIPVVRVPAPIPMDGRQIERSRYEKPPTWAYGVTTVPERNPEPLTRTLASLQSSGFDKPTLFVDGDRDWKRWEDTFRLPIVCRYPRIRTYGNWVLALIELYIRNPTSDYYAIFQDDFVCSRNLRIYLEKVKYPDKGYWNLYTFPENHIRIRDTLGFSRAAGWRGAGALALVFNHNALQVLLTHGHMASRINPRKPGHDASRAYRYVDGAVVETMEAMGYYEYVHNPSLLQHTGLRSTTNNPRHPQANSFRGEEYNLLDLLEEKRG
jgi:hypothetical protein